MTMETENVSPKVDAAAAGVAVGSKAENDDIIDDTPDFVDLNDAVEVEVGDDDVPMDEDDEEDEDGQMMEDAAANNREVVDISKATISSHTGPVYAVACHLDTTSQTLSVISGGGDDRAFMHRINGGDASTATHPLQYEHKDSVSAVALNLEYVSSDLTKTPRLAAVGAYDGCIALYDPDSGAHIRNLEGPTDVEWLAFHPKGGSVLLAGSAADGTIWMYHIPMNKCLQVFVGHESAVVAGGFSPDGRWALSASADGTVRIWAPRTGVSKHVFRLGDLQAPAGLTCMATNGGSDGKLIVVGAEDGQAHVCHIDTKKVVASLKHFEPPAQSSMMQDNNDEEEEMELPMSVEAVGFASHAVNPNWCATGGVDGVLKIWDLSKDGLCRQICQPPKPETDNNETNKNDTNNAGFGITRLIWHPTLPLVFTSCCDGSILLWDARNGKLVHSLTGHKDVVNAMDIRFNGNTAVIVSGSDDNSLKLFQVDDVEALMQQAAVSAQQQ